MMRKSLFFLLPILAALFLLPTLVQAAGKTDAGASQRLRLKARYYYLEGARLQAADDIPEAYEYFKKAHLIDPDYPEAAYSYGMTRILLKTDTLQTRGELLKSLSLMRPYVDAYPGDVFESTSYGIIAGHLDTVPETIRVYERLDTLRHNRITLIQLADAYMNAGRSQDALDALDRFESSEGKSPQLSLKKMGFMLAAGDTVGAVNEADALIASNPKEPTFRMLKGNLLEAIGRTDSVLACYLEAERLAPDNGNAKLALANYYKQQGDSVLFDRKMYEALLSEDFVMEEKLSLISEYLQTLLDGSNDTSRGDHLFSVLLEQYPHEPQVLDLSARYSGAKGDFTRAAQSISYAIDQDPDNIQYRGQLMRYQLSANDAKGARETYLRAREHSPEAATALGMLYATACSIDKDYDEAINTYTTLIHEERPDLPIGNTITDNTLLSGLNYEKLNYLSALYQMAGDTFYQMKDLEKTYSAYDNSLLFNPENTLALNNYAYFLSENGGDLDRALDMISKVIEQAPDNDTYLDTYAWVLFKRKDYDKALEAQRKALEVAEAKGEADNAEFFDHLGDILFMCHQPKEALENWKRALSLDPDNALIKKKVKHKTFFFE